MYMSAMQNCITECAEMFVSLDHDSNTNCDIQGVLTEIHAIIFAFNKWEFFLILSFLLRKYPFKIVIPVILWAWYQSLSYISIYFSAIAGTNRQAHWTLAIMGSGHGSVLLIYSVDYVSNVTLEP